MYEKKCLFWDKLIVMQTSVNIENLSREEKLQLMHTIWEDLVKNEKQIKSPEWHEDVLRETEERVIDWPDAKEELRKRFKWDAHFKKLRI